MKALSDKITKQQCSKHGQPYAFLCIEADCQHNSRIMCDLCINFRKMDGLINIQQAFQFFESYQSQEDERIYKQQANILQEFKRNKVQIIEQLNRLESLIEKLINPMNGNETIGQLKTDFFECEITNNTIQSLGSLLSGKVIVDDNGEYQFPIGINLIQQDGYIKSTDIINVQGEVIELLSKQINIIDININQDSDSMIDQDQCAQSFVTQDFRYSTDQRIKLDNDCYYICFNHNESQIAAAVGRSLILFNLSHDGIWVQDKQSLIGHHDDILKVKLNHNSTQMASCSSDKLVIIWCKQQNGQWSIQQKLKEHTGWVFTICYNYDSTILASGSEDKSIIIYHLYNDKWKLKQKLCEHTDNVYDVCFNHDSTLLASGNHDNSIILWECDNKGNWIVKQKLTGHTHSVWSVSFNKQSSCLISGSDDNTIIIWSVDSQNNWKCTQTLTGHPTDVLSTCFNKESNMILSCNADGSIKIWSINKEKQWECTQTINEHTNWVRNVIINSDSSMIISGSTDKTILIHNRISKSSHPLNNYNYQISKLQQMKLSKQNNNNEYQI